MERKARIRHCILILSALACSCGKASFPQEEIPVNLVLNGCAYLAKAYDPVEDRVTDLHIYVFNANDELENAIHTDTGHLGSGEEGYTCTLNLIKGKEYGIFACANLGYTPEVRNLEDLRNIRCHIAYPDDYREGIPMRAYTGKILIQSGMSIPIRLQRLMSKISIRIDRTKLSEDVSIYIRSIKIGNCPKEAFVFRNNSVADKNELFANGFTRKESECRPLNEPADYGISPPVSLYMLENMQGTVSNGSDTAGDKLIGHDDPRCDLASYVEISMDYESPRYITDKKRLKYRFWLGANHQDINVEGNCHYRIRICPEDDGLGAEGWRIDKSGLKDNYSQIFFHVEPGTYIQGNIGEQLHVRCEYTPSFAPLDIGLEELEEDRKRGIYDYSIDRDGKGVTLHLKNPGRGLLYFEAGEPVNESALVVVEVNRPGQ